VGGDPLRQCGILQLIPVSVNRFVRRSASWQANGQRTRPVVAVPGWLGVREEEGWSAVLHSISALEKGAVWRDQALAYGWMTTLFRSGLAITSKAWWIWLSGKRWEMICSVFTRPLAISSAPFLSRLKAGEEWRILLSA